MQYKICRKHLSRNMSHSFTQKRCAGQKRVPGPLPPGGINQQGAIDSNKKTEQQS